ncbi:MAG: prohibitin family protein [Cystobacterineae bacterium]|nr:prohibitin family protein [Cystobacterineae bacterium]
MLKYRVSFFVVLTLVFVGLIILGKSYHTVAPGFRGVQVTFGEVSQHPLTEGLHFINPFSSVERISVRQRTDTTLASAFSSDLQSVQIRVKVLHRIPETSVVEIFTKYQGEHFETLIAPRVQEAVKEVTALLSAEQIAKSREEVKQKALTFSRKKVGDLLVLEDLVIEDVGLSHELQKAIEAKMVQEQEASRARFVQLQAETEAQTAIVRAKGEAEALRIRGEALRQNPQVIEMNLVEKWNGVSPLVVGGGVQGPGIILPLDKRAAAK